MMVRLSEGKSSRQHSRRSCLETTQRAREETTATVQANIEAWLDAFALASTVHTAAVEHHTDMNSVSLLEHPEVELEMIQAAVVSQETDGAQAIESAQSD